MTITNKRRSISVVLVLTMVLSLLVGSLAYFTDRTVTDATATAGTVRLNIASEIDLDNVSDYYASTNSVDFFSPADMRPVKYTVQNVGNKSVDIKETIVMSVYDRDGNPLNLTGDANTQSELDIYDISNITGDEENGYFVKDGSTFIEVKSLQDNVITYNLPIYTLNGNEELGDMFREIEDGITSDERLNNFILLFNYLTENEFQACIVKLDILVEAKQHRNTSAVEWLELQSDTFIMSNGASVDVVEKVANN